MLMTSERRPAIRTMRGWAIDVLQEAGAIRECEEHGWMQDRADPQQELLRFVEARSIYQKEILAEKEKREREEEKKRET